MKIRIGTPAQGDNFFGRSKELDYAWSLIEDGNNLNLPSPRRVGKTSFALKMIDFAKNNDWRVIHINLEAHTEEGFIEKFIHKLNEQSDEKFKVAGTKVLDFIKGLKPTIQVPGATFSLYWQTHEKDIYQQLASLFDHTKPTLIFFDEVTVLMEKLIKKDDGSEKVNSFLHWLRDIRITPDSNIRWIYCSSVGIENFTHTHQLSETFNDLHKYELKSFDEKTSISMLRELSSSYSLALDDQMYRAIVNKLHYCLPFFIQLIFEKIRHLHEVEEKVLDAAIVDEAYNTLITEAHFNTWVERLEKQYGPVASYAMVLLRQICQQKQGVTRPNLQNSIAEKFNDPEKLEAATSQVLYMLTNDGYLIKEDDRYQFRSPLLRDFWHNRFVL